MKAIIFITLLILGTFSSVHSMTMQETDVVQFLEGALAGMSAQVSGLDSCVSDVESVGDDIDAAYQSFVQEDASGVETGLSSIGQALNALPSAMQQCQASYSSIQGVVTMIQSFTSPMSFVYHVGKDLLVNGKNIYSEISTAVNDYESQNFYDMGLQCGSALYQIFIGAQMTENIQLTTSEKDIVAFFEGFGEAVAIQIPNLANCIGDVVGAGQALYSAVQDFEQETEDGIKSGLDSVGSALNQLPAALQTCEASASSIEQIGQMLGVYNSFWSFAYHVGKEITINGQNIYDEVTSAVSAYESGQYLNMGYEIGTAIYQIFIQSSSNQMTENIQLNTTETDIVSFFEGFGEAVAIQIPNLANCIGDVYGAGQALYSAVQYFEQETEDGIKSGLSQVGTALNQLPAALQTCEASVASIQQIGKILGVYNSFWSFAYHVGDELLVNGSSIYNEVSTAVSDYESSQYMNMGYQIGNIVYQIFIQGVSMQEISYFQMTTTETDVVQFFEGVLQGLAVNIPGVSQCVSSVIAVGSEIDSAFKQFEQKDEPGIKAGLRSIGLIVQQIPNDLTSCKTSAASLLNIVKMASSFTNMWSFTYHVGKDLIINGSQIYGEINTAIGDYKTRQYKAAGVEVGNALFKIFVQSTTKQQM